MSLSNRQRAVGAVAYGMVRGMTEDEIVDRLSDDGLLSPDPQIIRTVEELEALDPDTLLHASERDFYAHAWGFNHYRLPAVVVASAENLRACREALEGETT